MESLRISLILRMIMSTGTALGIVTAMGIFLCPVQTPINADMCVLSTNMIFDVIKTAGIVPQAIATVGGLSVFWFSGKGSKN